jgi:hypothetical protein
MESDFIFSGYETSLDNLRRLHYSLDVEQLSLSVPEDIQLYRLSYPRLKILNSEMKEKLRVVRELALEYEKNPDRNTEQVVQRELAAFYYRRGDSQDMTLFYGSPPSGSDFLSFQPMATATVLETISRTSEEDVWIDGLLPSRTIDSLQSRTEEIYEKWANLRKYDEELLYRLGDFKRLVNLHYLTRLSEQMGITTKLDPVLSYPLGANSISILEAALAYHTIMTGKAYPVEEKLNLNMVPIITKIVDRQGKIVWEYTPRPREVLSGRVSELVTNILRLAMESGTGRSARDAVRMKIDIEGAGADIPIPCFGKTGTANRHTNSSFVGFIPGPIRGKSEVSLDEGYVVATYVGYDDNRPMKGKHIVIYGASGALPLWIDTVNTIANSKGYRENLEIADLVFDLRSIRMMREDRFLSLPVSSVSGLPVSGTPAGRLPEVLADAELKDDLLHLHRTFEPFKGAPDEDNKK